MCSALHGADIDRALQVWNSDERHMYILSKARHLEFDVYADKDEWSGLAFFKLEWLLAEPDKRIELQLEPQACLEHRSMGPHNTS